MIMTSIVESSQTSAHSKKKLYLLVLHVGELSSYHVWWEMIWWVQTKELCTRLIETDCFKLSVDKQQDWFIVSGSWKLLLKNEIRKFKYFVTHLSVEESSEVWENHYASALECLYIFKYIQLIINACSLHTFEVLRCQLLSQGLSHAIVS